MSVVALVPSKDRAASAVRTVEALAELEVVDRVVVIDDGSTDSTAQAARDAGARVVRLGLNRGKAAAIAAGVEAEPDADVYLLIDADVGEDARHAPTLLAPVLADEADLVIGVLPAAGKRGGFGMVRRFAHWGIQRGSGVDTAAPLSGQRAVRGPILRGIGGSSRFGLEVAMTIDAARTGARVLEVEVPMEHLHTGRTVAGFRHRATQGRDIALALWPRLVPAAFRRVGLVAMVLGLIALSVVSARASSVEGTPIGGKVRHVVVFGIPHIGLDDLDSGVTPNLDRMAASGARGMMTVRTRGGTASASAYATLGAGSQVGVPSASGQVANRDALVEGSPAIDVLGRRTGHRPSGRVVVLTMPSARRTSGTYANSLPGSLSDALHGAGLDTAVIANSDSVDGQGNRVHDAPAAWAVASSAGAVGRGTVGESLTVSDAAWPFGMRAAVAPITKELESVVDHRGLVVVDPGDTDRAAAYAPGMLPDEANIARLRALESTDAVLGALTRHLPADTLVIVAGMSPPSSRAELVPVVLWGAGIPRGRLESPSTTRRGLVTLTDLAPTILSSLGVKVPVDMIGRPVRVTAGPVDWAAMRATNDAVVARDKSYSPFLHSFVTIQIVLYLLATVALLRRDTPRLVRRLLRFAFVAVTAVPAMTFLLRAVPPLASLGAGSVLILYAACALVAWWLHDRGATPWGPLVAVSAVSLGVICVDVLIGAPLQQASLLGYSPTAAARFVGVGNATYGILAATVMIVMAWIVGRSPRPRDAWWPAVALGVLVIVVDGAPWLGSDVGGILSLVPAVGILAVLLRGRRLSVKTVLVPLIGAVVVLGAVIGYEALQPAAGRDHIGRFFLGGGEGGGFSTTILRKLSTNLSLSVSSTWSRLLIIVPLFAAVLYLFGRCWDVVVPRASWVSKAMIGIVVVTLLGYALNDSGAMAAAIIFVYLGAFLALPALDDRRDTVEVLEPVDAPAGAGAIEEVTC